MYFAHGQVGVADKSTAVDMMVVAVEAKKKVHVAMEATLLVESMPVGSMTQ